MKKLANLEKIVIQADLVPLDPKFYVEEHTKNPPNTELGKKKKKKKKKKKTKKKKKIQQIDYMHLLLRK